MLIKSLALRLRALFARQTIDRDLDDEIQFHLEQETARYVREGMTPDDARRRARVAFGNVTVTREAHRGSFGVRWVQDFAADVRHAIRALRHTPVLSGAAILTIALGIGGVAAIFSAVNGVILRPLPFADPDRLVMLYETNPDYQWTDAQVAPANMFDWRERVTAFQDVAGYADFTSPATITGFGSPLLVTSTAVTGNFLSVLGVRPQLGRVFREDETWENGASVAIISDRLWRSTFGADSGLIGRSITIDGAQVEIVGVVPSSFRYPFDSGDLWQPMAWPAANRAQIFFRRAHWLRAIARVKPDVPLETANAELQTVVGQLSTEYAVTNRVMGAGMMPLQEWTVRGTQRPLAILLASVAFLLVIACANVANLLLVRAAGRERESAMRLALGAGRGRLVRQAITEGIVLSLIGGGVGLAIGWWGTQALVALQPAGMLPAEHVRMDQGVLAFALALATLCGVAFGVAPAIWNARRSPADVMKEGGRGTSLSPRVRRLASTLVIGEVAIALVLTVGAGLLVRSFVALTQVPPGFDPNGVLTVQLTTGGVKYDSARKVIAFYQQAVERVSSIPGVTSASASSQVPLTDWGWTGQFAIAGRAEEIPDEVAHRQVAPNYFATMRVPILRGRDFTEADVAGAERVTIINESLARRFFADQDPINQRVTYNRVPDSTSIWYTVVGVVGDEHQTSLGVDAKMQFTEPFAQAPRQSMSLVIRTDGDPGAIAPPVRRVVADLDPDLAITTMRPMTQVRDASLAQQRFMMAMLACFAIVGVILAIVGVYGVMAQVARGRTRELGIRMALGAPVASVRWLVVRHGLRLVTIGLAIGLAAALFATQALRALLFGVSPGDPPTFIVVPVLLLATAALAAWIPAVRASAADPALTLREE